MPGDWVEARFFSWVFDVADVTLEADGSSTLGKEQKTSLGFKYI